MKKICCFVVFLLCVLPLAGFSEFKELGKNSKVLEKSFDFSSSSLQIVQKKWLDKKYLSELDIAFAPTLRGVNYVNSYSMDLTYRFFINWNWAVQFQYSRHSNYLTKEGQDEVQQKIRLPVETKYSQKRSYVAGIDWYPFYGKALLYNRLVYFDLYLSVLGGKTELFDQKQAVPIGSLALGLVCWWSKHLNTRWELQGLYYNYYISSDRNPENRIEEYIVKTAVSIGVLF